MKTQNEVNVSVVNVVINAASANLKTVGTDLRSGNKEYTSISRVLKDIQRKDMLASGYAQVFAAVGLDAGKITPAAFFALCTPEQYGQTFNKKGEPAGEPWVGIWGTAVKKNVEGQPVLGPDGSKVTEPVLRKVSSWTPNKLFKVLAQAQAFKANKK